MPEAIDTFSTTEPLHPHPTSMKTNTAHCAPFNRPSTNRLASHFAQRWLALLIVFSALAPAAYCANTFTAGAPLATARHDHTSTLLPNGKLLVVGGQTNGGGYLASAELYDPATGAWSAAGVMAHARAYHAATLLPNGKVLVSGGQDASFYYGQAELYDPGTGVWTSTGSLSTPRTGHTATLLPNGRVLIAGGYSNGYLASAELYNPATETWSSGGRPGGDTRLSHRHAAGEWQGARGRRPRCHRLYQRR